MTKERHEQLADMKGAGETYDELLAEAIQALNRERLAEKARAAKSGDADDYVPLDEC